MDKPLKILIAEDEYLCLMGIKANLKKLGYEIIGEASDGKEAVKLALDLEPDLIIIDINMPSLDGIEAIKRINSIRLIPSIIVSGYHDQELIEKASVESIFGYLVKPVDAKDLNAAIKVAISRYNEIKDLEDELKDTKTSLKNRKHIERAKGILMDRKNLKEAEAMKELQKMSRNNNKKMIVIAKEIIKANQILG
ncbi:ANTAR domain-containing response regulator [Orenia marismortui]|uniref:Stage 0 sporulation protein A homolog n=1 Tax=Orenia marismortui TaxID=46469 RepID=A0A4R8GT47_9FIRM|nr:response regulator [Orenia marismortui]TDX49216.1 response regulator receiver and ANTAR domain protein [Orenia marismortui]